MEPRPEHPFATRPIPILTPSGSPNSARNAIPVNAADPRFCEALVDVRELGIAGDNFYSRQDGSNPPYNAPIEGAIHGLFLRESAAVMLEAANAALKAHSLHLYVFDGYRPISTQQGLWRHFNNLFRARYPGFSEKQLEEKTLEFVSDPRNFDPSRPHEAPPLHATGGAVDLTLREASGAFLDLGTPFDDSTSMAVTDRFERRLLDRDEPMGTQIKRDDPRLVNRRILYWTMREAGFTNYLFEWWHFDFGNQMHVLSLELIGEPLPSRFAWYGYAECPVSA